jgi:hypothetical protein
MLSWEFMHRIGLIGVAQKTFKTISVLNLLIRQKYVTDYKYFKIVKDICYISILDVTHFTYDSGKIHIQ